MSEVPISLPVILVSSVKQEPNDSYNSDRTRDAFTFQLPK